jgi:hypothetical protein
MILPNLSVESLKALPLRALVAFAARMSRRVEPLAQLSNGDPARESRRAAVDAALRAAEDFARGVDPADPDAVVRAVDATRGLEGDTTTSDGAAASACFTAHAMLAAGRSIENRGRVAARHLWERTPEARQSLGNLADSAADHTAMCAYTAGAEAFYALGMNNEAPVAGALSDYRRLLDLCLGAFPEPGVPIDPSPAGPLGPY